MIQIIKTNCGEAREFSMSTVVERSVTLIRHAKSSWDNPLLRDFERPLNKRGRRDGPAVGAALASAGIVFDKVLCSDARRARETLDLIRNNMKIKHKFIDYKHELYGAGANVMLSMIISQPAQVHHLALIGHNPGMEDLANRLAESSTGKMSTGCAIQLLFDCKSWAGLASSTGKTGLLIRPKDL